MSRKPHLRSAILGLVAFVWLAGSSPPLAADALLPGADYAGKPLSEALSDLKSLGLPILFTDAVVRPGMRVIRNPQSRDPRAALDQILEGHPLEVREMPDGQLVIVPKRGPQGSLLIAVDLPDDYSGEIGVAIPDAGIEIRSDASEVLISNVPAGEHTIVVSVSGFIPRTLEDVSVRESSTTPVAVSMEPILYLAEIDVTPAHLELRKLSVSDERHLSSEQIETIPHAGDDLMRAVSSSPGVVESDFSARFNARGGGETETLVMLDGVELYEPFHLKDFLSVFSIIDTAAVDEVDLLPGAFTAEYGDRMSAVMDVSIQDAGTTTSELMIGTLNSRVFSSGRFNGDRGEWLVTGRGWYPSQLPDSTGLLEGEIVADYYDLLARFSHPIGSRTKAALGILSAYDDLSFREAEESELDFIAARYRSSQSWIVLDGALDDTTLWRATASVTDIERERSGEELDLEDGHLLVSDERRFRSIDFRSDWSWSRHDRHLIRWGGGFKNQDAFYDYSRSFQAADEATVTTAPDIHLEPEGYSYHAYLSDRFRFGERAVVELGLRWDHQDWSEDSQLSPRANLKVGLTRRTDLRLGWGIFHQSQRLNELSVQDGLTQFSGAERAEHLVLSIVHTLPSSWTMRGAVYDKRFERLQPRYENLFSQIELFPESRSDRILVAPDRAHARGLELMIRNGLASRVSWWLGYVRSEAEDVIDGRDVPRSWDQRHSVDAGIAFALPWDIQASLGGSWHSGRPTTPVSLEWEEEEGELEPVIVRGPRNSTRLEEYGRIDLRLSRSFPLSYGNAAVVLQAFNATNRENVCYIEDFEVEGEGETARIIPEMQSCSPIIPTLSVRWQF